MTRAYDVMTRAVATCTPETPVNKVAAQMRDLNIGDVLVVEKGKLVGIVTDRDLTIHALTDGVNASTAPVGQFMTSQVVTGQPDWTIEHIAQVMGEHQVRRLPIVEGDEIVGIVSLGDVAVHSSKKQTVGESLREISESTRARFYAASPLTKFVSIAIPVGLTAVVLIAANTKQGRRLTKQLKESDLPNKAYEALQSSGIPEAAIDALHSSKLPAKAKSALEATRDALQDPHTRQAVVDLVQQARGQAGELSTRLPKLQRRARQKRFLFA